MCMDCEVKWQYYLHQLSLPKLIIHSTSSKAVLFGFVINNIVPVIFPSLWSKVSLILVHCSLYSHSRHTSCVFHLTSPRPFLPRERSAFTDFFTETVSLFFLVSLWLFSSSQHLCPLPSHSFSFNDEFPLYPWWMSLLLPSFSVS